MGRLIDCNDVYNAIQITTDNFGLIKEVVETDMLTMLLKIETAEAIPKDQYEARLKADVVAILGKIRAEIENNMESIIGKYDSGIPKSNMPSYKIERNKVRKECISIIDKYKAESEE